MNDDKFSTYADCLSYMFAQLPMFQRIGPSAYKKDLTNTIALCKVLGNPQEKLKTIHIAGTNGKGTTTHIIAAGLQAQGYKVGVYTSPHYKDFRERIKINGTFISKRFILRFINDHIDELENIKPSFFEMTVGLAFAYFAEQDVDYAIIETGLGGRLDSTNIITPLVSVITNISYDHQNLLGDTLEAIASEKAGIIKKGVPAIIGERQENIQHVFIQKAKESNASIVFAEDVLQLKSLTNQEEAFRHFCVTIGDKIWIDDLKTDLYGPFQDRNLITGLYTLYHLSIQITLDVEKIKIFFPRLKEFTHYIGRWQILDTNPLIIADSAHNEGGLRLIINELKNIHYESLHIVLGFVNDKDLDKVLSLFPTNATYYFAKANIPRGLPANELKTLALNHNLIGKSYSSVKRAFAAAKKKGRPNDLIYVGGSIFVVAEVL